MTSLMTSTVFDCFYCIGSLVEAAKSHGRSEIEPIKGMSQKKHCWTQFHLSAHQRKLVLTFPWRVIGYSAHTELLSVCWMGGRFVLLLNHPWNVSKDVTENLIWRPVLYKRFHFAAIKKTLKQSELQKMSLFFQRFPYRGGFVWHSYWGDDELEDVMPLALMCPFLQFVSLTFTAFQFCVWKAAM